MFKLTIYLYKSPFSDAYIKVRSICSWIVFFKKFFPT